MPAFDALGGNELDRAATLEHIARASLNAMCYDQDQDPGQRYRTEMAEQRERKNQLIAAAHTLRAACVRGDKAMMWALGGGNNPLGATLTRPHDGQLVPVLDIGAAFFLEMDNTLEGSIPELQAGECFWLHHTIGNLHYDRSLQSGQRVVVSTMLAWELTFHLKRFTAGRARCVVYSCQRMPTDGKPCARLVVDLVNAALGSRLTEKNISDRLSRLPAGVGLIEWPHYG